jgi:dihydrolipoamide dehydrogenase
MLKAKEQSVSALTKGVEFLFKQNKVDYIKGTGSFVSPNQVRLPSSHPYLKEIYASVVHNLTRISDRCILE